MDDISCLLRNESPQSVSLVDDGYRDACARHFVSHGLDLLRRSVEALDPRRHGRLITDMQFEICWASNTETLIKRIRGGRAERIREQAASFAGMVRRLADPTPLPSEPIAEPDADTIGNTVGNA